MASQRTVELSKIGSDPEFSLAIADPQRQLHLLSAERLVGSDKELRLRSFIGTDGHASTAELRPAPCRNVYWHLVKIADGLAEVRRSMRYYGKLKGQRVVAVAQPSLGPTETMGGHIWISMWYKSKLSSDVIHISGNIYDNVRRDYYRSMQDRVQKDDAIIRRISDQRFRQYSELAKMGSELSLDICWKKLHYLIWPLEAMLYGNARADRTGPGVRDPFIRLPDRHFDSDLAMYRKGSAYIRFEYRIPSTQLQHPTLAFVYFGLAKLAILNWDDLPELPVLNAVIATDNGTHSGYTQEWRNKLQSRLTELRAKPGFRMSKDLTGLFEAVNSLCSVNLQFPALIDFNAWASLKPPSMAVTEEGDSW